MFCHRIIPVSAPVITNSRLTHSGQNYSLMFCDNEKTSVIYGGGEKKETEVNLCRKQLEEFNVKPLIGHSVHLAPG